MPSVSKSEKKWSIDRISKKKSVPPKIVVKWKISANNGGREVFFVISLIAQFFSDFKTDGIKLKEFYATYAYLPTITA